MSGLKIHIHTYIFPDPTHELMMDERLSELRQSAELSEGGGSILPELN
jgi:hypothetical protein